jgi:micrococcal nuclease
MSRPRHLLVVLVVVALAGCTVTISGPTTDGSDLGPETPLPAANGSNISVADGERVHVEILDVVDGDTVDVRLPDGSEDTVRLVGVDTPEVHVENDPAEFEGIPDSEAGSRCLREAGHDASASVEGRLAAGNVSLVFGPDTERRGSYGRLLAYVYVGERNLNYALVATGHARVYETDFVLRDRFDAAEQHARTDQRALWTCQTAG